MLSLAAKRSQFAFPVTFARCELLTPFHSAGPNPSSSRWGLPRRTTLLRLGVPCGLPERLGKMSLASLCNRSTTRAPTDRSIPERATFVELTAYRTDTCSGRRRGVLLPCGNSTPGGTHLTARFQLRRNRPQPCPMGKAEHRTGRCHLAAAFSTACKVVRFGLWHFLYFPAGFGDRIVRGSESLSVRSSVNESAFPGPKCLPSTSAPEGARHRARGLATGEPASSALSPRECLRTSRLDHPRSRRLFTRGRNGRTLLVNFCNRHDPRPQPLERPNPARGVDGVTHPHCAA